MKKIYRSGLIFFVSTLLIVGCSQEPDKAETQQTPVVKKMKGRTLNLYNWEEYIGSKTLENFEKETGIHVNEITFEDEEDMLGAVQSDLAAFDLVVSSDDLVREMRVAKILARLDYSKIPNFKHIAKKYRNMPCDPEQKYTVPYLTGTTGMAINKKYIKDDADSWKVLFDKRYKGKLAMLNNSFEVVAAASKSLGYSINITSPEKMDIVRKLLLEQKPLLQGYCDTETLKDLLVHEKVWAVQIYSGEGLVAADENENLEYVIPKEGAPVWVDFFVMPRDAKHKEEAHMFLNYVLRPEVNASIASELWYATPNEAAEPLMDPEVLNSKSVYPPAEVMERCEFFEDTGKATRFIAPIWSDLTVTD
ncbi:MAG: spermidine/putrescine ABC transporter substrate-binding protein [Deltaproteobacteria bacterium]|nr:spermidine/putrescine ABC transporter substrate-binding protein [Deltaproteobacteria bacterium]